MDLTQKTWNTTKTGMIYHSFKADGTAVCRSSIKAPVIGGLVTEKRVDERLAQAWGARVRGFRKCETCSTLEAKAAERAEASMQPSTGEGDHLPPAAECTCPPSPSANDYHAVGRPKALSTEPGETRDCSANGCSLAYPVMADGTLTKHLNDELEPCPGKAPLPKRRPGISWGAYHNEEN